MRQTNEKHITLRFGESVKFFRQQKALTQEKLAELAEIDRRYISQIELGKQNPSLVIMSRIAKALRTPLSVIIQRAEHTD